MSLETLGFLAHLLGGPTTEMEGRVSDLKIKIDQPSYEERLQGYMAIHSDVTNYYELHSKDRRCSGLKGLGCSKGLRLEI